MPNWGGTFRLGFHSAIAFLFCSFCRYFYAYIYINTDSYVLFLFSPDEGNCILVMMVSRMFYSIFFPSVSFTHISDIYTISCSTFGWWWWWFWKQSFSTQRCYVRCRSVFLRQMRNREKERKTRKTTVLFLFSF